MPRKPKKVEEAVKIPEPALETTTHVAFSALSDEESQERTRLETEVAEAFYRAGCALRQLRDKQLYRSTHQTFEDYARDVLGYSRIRLYQLIQATEVYESLEKHVNGALTLPTNEYQCRPLYKLDESDRLKAWERAQAHAQRSSPTYVQVVHAVKEVLEAGRPPDNPYYVGDLVKIEAKQNPDLFGRSGHLAIVRERREFACVIETPIEELIIKPEYLTLVDEANGIDAKDHIERLIAVRNNYEPTSLGSLLLRYYAKRTTLDGFEQSVLEFLEDLVEEQAT